MKRIYVMLKGDFKNISRDFMLLFILISPAVIAVAFNFIIPFADNLLTAELGFQLSDHNIFIMAFIIMLVPMMYGMMIGFIILEERDENILSYLFVTPLSKIEYILYRTGFAMVMSTGFNIFILYYLDLVEVRLLWSLPVLILSALNAILLVLIILVFAENKVEGFAVTKGAGVLFLAPLIGYLIESNFRYLAGLLPPYWISESFISIYNNQDQGNYFIYLLAGLIVYSSWIYLLGRKFNK
ncbi:MAG: ABC transporter permease [Bacillota bacterium]